MGHKNTYIYKSITQKLAVLGGAAVFAVGISSLQAEAGSLAEIQERGVMKVVTEDNFFPYEFTTDGNPDGFHADVVAELREYADFKIEQDQLPWTGLLASVTAGKYDAAITGAAITEERLGTFDFAAPISLNVSYYITRADEERINGVADLSGLTVGVQAGSAQLAGLADLEAKLAKTGGSLGQIVEYQSYPEIYADLANGRLDYVVNSGVNAGVLVKERPEVFALGEPTSGKGYIAWPVDKGNEDLLAFLTGFVNHMSETGKLAELQEKWFGLSFDDLPQESITTAEQFNALRGAD
jgi:polar amino acid transport system substrate-binding protein